MIVFIPVTDLVIVMQINYYYYYLNFNFHEFPGLSGSWKF